MIPMIGEAPIRAPLAAIAREAARPPSTEHRESSKGASRTSWPAMVPKSSAASWIASACSVASSLSDPLKDSSPPTRTGTSGPASRNRRGSLGRVVVVGGGTVVTVGGIVVVVVVVDSAAGRPIAGAGATVGTV